MSSSEGVDPFTGFFLVLAALCGGIVYRTWTADSTEKPERFITFQRTYLAIWLCMMMADWLQGPYVYAL